jgi:hypothetical protein
MAIRRFTVPLTTGTATGTAYTPYFSGKIESVQYIKAGSNNFTDGVDFAITADVTGETIWAQDNVNASAVVRPRAATHTTAGVAALYAASGTAVLDKIALSRDRVKVTVAQAGNGTTGTFVVTVDDGR